MSILSKNLKLLRKSKKMSQADLAEVLDINRSNVAAYESKNVEPRLRIILEISKFFEVSINDLLERDIETEGTGQTDDSSENSQSSSKVVLPDEEKVQEFLNKSTQIKKVLNGFRAFYSYKIEQIDQSNDEIKKLTLDIENFLQLMDHLLQYNESVINTIMPSAEN